VVTILTTKALDITGIVTSGALAIFGMFVIPYKRKQVKEEFNTKMAELRESLRETLSKTFNQEAETAVNRLTENIAPYVDYVNNEQKRLEESRQTLTETKNELNSLEAEISDLLK
jgi:peptidoglycan hydrolase CwlO-like protein